MLIQTIITKMDNNVYQAPKSNVLKEEDRKKNLPLFYVVSPKKYWVLFISTMGIYELYWFYKNWENYKINTKSNLWAIPRAIFAIFFVYRLFEAINNRLIEKIPDSNWKYSAFPILYILITIFERISDSIIPNETLSLSLTLASVPIIGWLLYQAQQKVNIICDSPKGEDNANFTVANFIWIALGVLLWLVSLGSMLLLFNDDLMNAFIDMTA